MGTSSSVPPQRIAERQQPSAPSRRPAPSAAVGFASRACGLLADMRAAAADPSGTKAAEESQAPVCL